MLTEPLKTVFDNNLGTKIFLIIKFAQGTTALLQISH